jgi:hypothetical protein
MHTGKNPVLTATSKDVIESQLTNWNWSSFWVEALRKDGQTRCQDSRPSRTGEKGY